MDDAHILAKLLEDAVESRDLETADSRAEVDESLFNAIEHGMTTEGAHSHVRYLPDRRGMAFDCVVVDRGPGVRANPGKGPDLPRLESDRESLQLAVQDRGVDVARPGPRPPEGPHPDNNRSEGLWVHSGTALVRGEDETHFTETDNFAGAMIRMVVPT